MSQQETLPVDSTPTAADAPKDVWVDLYSLQCQRVLGIPDWRWCKVECVEPDAILLEGAVCTAVFKTGPRKGRQNWDKRDKSTDRRLVLTRAEISAFARQWETETGKCSKCFGTGKELRSSHVTEGNTYRDCQRCSATGKAVTP